jgi:hypothetical protein
MLQQVVYFCLALTDTSRPVQHMATRSAYVDFHKDWMLTGLA